MYPVNVSIDVVGSEWIVESLHVRCTCRAWQMFLEHIVSEVIARRIASLVGQKLVGEFGVQEKSNILALTLHALPC